MDLALAAPDKEDVAGVWTYRVAALQQLEVPIRTGVEPTVDTIRTYRPDLIVIATGATPRDAPFPTDANVPVMQAWDVLRRPELIPEGSSVTVVGGGMVGIEIAECIAKRARQVTIFEGQGIVAKEMARNNRWDVLLRLRDANARILTDASVVSIEGDTILCSSGQTTVRHPAGDVIVLAIGPRPLRDGSPQLACALARTGRSRPRLRLGQARLAHCRHPGQQRRPIGDVIDTPRAAPGMGANIMSTRPVSTSVMACDVPR
jgi:NADPH-dependent 2,4-dienoyl-CoA reductase/sulfur reductase-like enzyme